MDGLLAWQNLVFLLPLAFGALLAVGLSFGIGGDHDHDAGHESDSHGHDAAKEAGKETGKETGKSIKASQGPLEVTGHELGFNPVTSFLDLLGVGRVPFTVLLITMSLTWGVIGYFSNVLLKPMLVTPYVYGCVSMGVAFVGMTAFTGRIARLLNRFGASNESYVRPRSDLAGRVGEVVADTDAGRGFVLVTDGNNLKQQVSCRSSVAIPSGKQVLITEYVEEHDHYVVEEYRDDVGTNAS